MLELFVALLSAACNIVLGALVLAKNPHAKLNRYFALFAVTLGLWSTTNYISLHPVFFSQLMWIRIVMALVAFMMLFMTLLANTFPTGQPFKQWIERAFPWMAVIASITALSPFLFPKVSYAGGQIQPVPGPGMVLFLPFILLMLFYSISVLVIKLRRLKGIAKEYVRYGLIGIVATFVLLLLSNFIVVLAFHSSILVPFSPLITLVFTASFAYGIVRRRLFDIRLIITRFVAYLSLSVVAGMLYGLVSAGLSYLIAGFYPNMTQITISAVIIGILILFAEPLRQFFNHATRKIFYQDDYETKDILDQLASVLVRASETRSLANESIKVLRTALKSEFITLLLIETDDEGNERRIRLGHPLHAVDELSTIQLHHHVGDVVSIDADESRDSSPFWDMLRQGNVSVVVRLETKSEVVGYGFFGYKTTGSAYTKRDTDLIRIANDELAVAIQNTLRFDQIQAFNDTLRQRIEDATKELRASNEQLHRLDAAKDEFVSMASHQLRTPLTSVKGYISMVLEGDAGKITAVQRQLLSEAFTSSERMVHLINDFLNVSRLQTGKFVIEAKPTNLAKVVAEEVESLQTTASAHDLLIQYRAPSVFPTLYIDDGKIRQVIMNFIDNAIYYSKEHTTIYVELSNEDGDAVLRVRDTGIGVPKVEQAHLFTKFFRATNARKQRPDGTGVGLFLTKKVITAHGGSIVFESVEGEGSTFGFRLPIKKLSAVPAQDTDQLNK